MGFRLRGFRGGFRASRAKRLGLRVWDYGLRMWGWGFRVWGLGFRVWGLRGRLIVRIAGIVLGHFGPQAIYKYPY